MKLRSYLLTAMLLVAAMLQSCGPGDPGVFKNGQIKPGKLNDFHQLDNILFDALKTNKVSDAENLMSKTLLSAGDYKRTFEMASSQCRSGSYDILDEYYIINYKPSDTHTIPTTAADGNKYTFYCTTITEEMYVAFMVPKAKGDKYLLTAVFCKYDYGWKLNDLEFEPYTITGKTAPQLYKLAKKQYDKNYIVDAYISMSLVYKCMRPNILWIYPQNKEMEELNGMLVDVMNSYTYPLVMKNVKTKPKIFQVTHLTTDEGVFPSIEYVTTIDINNTDALEKEKEEMKDHIGKSFPGIDKDKKYIYFTAFHEKPSSKYMPPFVNMVGKLPWIDLKH